jgi:hypothetical protein
MEILVTNASFFVDKKKFSHCLIGQKKIFMLPNVCANLSQIVGPLPSSLTAPSCYIQENMTSENTYIRHKFIPRLCSYSGKYLCE